MDGRRFDDLARVLAHPIDRRCLIGRAIAFGAVWFASRAARAEGQGGCAEAAEPCGDAIPCCADLACCDGVCCDVGYGCCSGICCPVTCCGEECCWGADFADLVCCDGHCTVARNNPANCGGCGITCQSGELCCDVTCIPSVDPKNCGGCGVTCGPCQVCTDVGGVGACVSACGRTEGCQDGVCVECPPGTIGCTDGTDVICVDPATDPEHCGDCLHFCGAGDICVDGVCQASGGEEPLPSPVAIPTSASGPVTLPGTGTGSRGRPSRQGNVPLVGAAVVLGASIAAFLRTRLRRSETADPE
jgi:hypothetical protein